MADVKQSLMNAVSSRVADFPRRPVRPRPGRELALRQTAQTFRPVVFHRCPFFRRQENHRTVRRFLNNRKSGFNLIIGFRQIRSPDKYRFDIAQCQRRIKLFRFFCAVRNVPSNGSKTCF